MRQVFFFFTVLSIVLAVTSSPRVHAQSDAQYNLPDLADSNSLQHYVRQVWTTREGLPHNSVNAMVQDQSGYLWLGTWQGPTRFNGRGQFLSPAMHFEQDITAATRKQFQTVKNNRGGCIATHGIDVFIDPPRGIIEL